MRKTIIALILICGLLSAPTTFGEQYVDRIVAVVNGEIITLFELDQKSKQVIEEVRADQGGSLTSEQRREIKGQVLQNMVDNLLLRQEAERMEMEVSDADVRSRIRKIKKSQGWDDQRLNQMLAKDGLSREEFEERLKKDILRHRLVGGMVQSKVMVTDKEVQEFYQKHKDRFQHSKKVLLRLLVVSKQKRALDLRKRISQGKLDFATAAKRYSQGPAAGDGGDLGWVQWSDLGPKWREVLDSTPLGAISAPFSIQGQTALLYLENEQQGESRPIAAVRDEIVKELRGPKFKRQLEAYLQRLRDKAVIDIRL